MLTISKYNYIFLHLFGALILIVFSIFFFFFFFYVYVVHVPPPQEEEPQQQHFAPQQAQKHYKIIFIKAPSAPSVNRQQLQALAQPQSEEKVKD